MILNELWRHYPGKISEFLWIQDEGKSNEGRERGGGGEEEEKMEKYPHYSIDMKSTLPIEVITL